MIGVKPAASLRLTPVIYQWWYKVNQKAKPMSKHNIRARILILSLWHAPYRLARTAGVYSLVLSQDLEQKLLRSLGA